MGWGTQPTKNIHVLGVEPRDLKDPRDRQVLPTDA